LIQDAIGEAAISLGAIGKAEKSMMVAPTVKSEGPIRVRALLAGATPRKPEGDQRQDFIIFISMAFFYGA
jgi:hypothetical protein